MMFPLLAWILYSVPRLDIALVPRIQRFAEARGTAPCVVNIAWLLNQAFPCVAVVPLPALPIIRRTEYERSSQLVSDLDLPKDGVRIDS